MSEKNISVSHVAYGVLMGSEELSPFSRKVGKKLPKEIIQQYMEHPRNYEEADPLYWVGPDEILDVFNMYLKRKYPQLSIARFNDEEGCFSDYMIFVPSTLQVFNGIGSIDFLDISPEEERQLNKFIRKFLPIKTDGWKVWSSPDIGKLTTNNG